MSLSLIPLCCKLNGVIPAGLVVISSWPALARPFTDQFNELSWAPGVRSTETFSCGTFYACCILVFCCLKSKLAICNCANAFPPSFFFILLCSCCDMIAKYFLPPHMKGTWMRIPSTVLNLTSFFLSSPDCDLHFWRPLLRVRASYQEMMKLSEKFVYFVSN